MTVAPGLVVALLVAAATWIGCGGSAPEPPHVLLVTLDTTRADHLGLYGYQRPTSPNLDELARRAVVYERAYSVSSWTLPAHASLFTGRFPASHGVRHEPEGSLVLADEIRAAPSTIRARRLAEGERTLAQMLRERGYRTGAVVAGPWMIQSFGLATGFDEYDDDGIRDATGRRAEEVTDRAMEWLAHKDQRPFFLFLNYFDPHAPYLPPARFAGRFLPPGTRPDPRRAAHAVRLYDAEILYMDHHLGRLLHWLEDRGWLDATLVVVTSDHGELLGDHGTWGHERYLWEPLLRVPLIVKPAGFPGPGRREAHPISLVDVAPLVLEAVGAEVPDAMQGEPPPARRRPLLAEVNPMSPGGAAWRARWDGAEKLLESSSGERLLFDVERDPEELENLADARPDALAQASERLRRAFDALDPPPADGSGQVVVDPVTEQALRALGYLQEASPPLPPEASADP
jgi:arylsulfatase A-like enzyme